MYIGLIIRIKIGEMKKGTNEWSTVRWIESRDKVKGDYVKNEDVKWKIREEHPKW